VPFVNYETDESQLEANTASCNSPGILPEDKLTDERVINIDDIEYGHGFTKKKCDTKIVTNI